MHQSYPKHTTINDLVSTCPGCKWSVSWPFTQDPFQHMEREGVRGLMRAPRYPSTKEELDILNALYPDTTTAWSVGTKVRTKRDETGRLWHEPCYMNYQVKLYQYNIARVCDILDEAIESGFFGRF